MSKEITFLEEVREDRGDLARAAKKHPGFWEHFEDFYPDSAHFIYELLQNAEDEKATSVSFSLNEHNLIFEHNGDPFSEDDVRGITDISRGTKKDDEEKIGRFGVGFKSVFAYTNTPSIYSPTYSFKLEERVLPVELPRDESLGNSTRFVFHLGCETKSSQEAYEDIYKWLSELSEISLLFLTHLKELHWCDLHFQRIKHSEYHYEVRKKQKKKTVISQHFLRYSELVTGLNSQYVSVAFLLTLLEEKIHFDPKIQLSQQFKIVAAEPGTVSVSFPAINETSGLNFHLHAPFITGRSRESIKRDHNDNRPLFEQLAELVSGSLFHIRDTNFLTAEFLSVLPNKKDSLQEPYTLIREAILETMNEQQLTPTYYKGYAPAKTLVQSKASLKRLLSKTDVSFLSEYFERRNDRNEWAIGISQKNSRLDHFLTSLDIPNWKNDDFIDLLKQNANIPTYQMKPDEELLAWLISKSDVWMQSLYAFLYSELNNEDRFGELESLLIVRMCDGSLRTGSGSYFQSDEDQNDTTFRRVNKSIYTSGKNEKIKKKAREFLVEIGVREVEESDLIKSILDDRYKPDRPDTHKYLNEIGTNTLSSDMKRFIHFLEENPRNAHLFKNYFLFETDDGRGARPSWVYLDTPFYHSGLKPFYGSLKKGYGSSKYSLTNRYLNLEIDPERIGKFAIAVGATIRLVPDKSPCCWNPSWDELSDVAGKRRTSSSIDEDYEIEGLGEVLEKPSIEISCLIWKTLCSLPDQPNYLEACYQRNEANGARCAPSQLVHTLRSASWIPQNNDTFVKPVDASVEMLPDGFPYDSGQKWLSAVEFGRSGQKRKEQRRTEQNIANKLGLSLEDVDIVKQNKEEFEQFKEQIKRKAANKHTIDNSSSGNIERRRQKNIERLKKAPTKNTTKRVRSVRAYSKSEYDGHALLDYYFNVEEDQPFCQLCCDTMPFVNQKEEVFVEYVDLLSKRWADHDGVQLPVMTDLKLVLCPVCSEIYQQYIHKDVEAQKRLFSYLLEDHEDDFIICDREKRRDGKDNTLRFDQKHLDGIRVCLESLTLPD